MIVLILTLTLVWLAMQQSLTFADLLVGLVLSGGFALLARRFLRQAPLSPDIDPAADLPPPRTPQFYLLLLPRVIVFLGFVLWSILKANLEVARIVLRPRLNIRPGIIAVPLDVRSANGVTLLANLITLTPGTVTLDVSADRRTIYVHAIDIGDAEAIRADIKQNFERRVMEFWP
jgi:multicomponent Na+:H+ antiporter subunit E